MEELPEVKMEVPPGVDPRLGVTVLAVVSALVVTTLLLVKPELVVWEVSVVSGL